MAVPQLPALPVDKLQPWEAGRAGSGITEDSELLKGYQRHDDDTTATEQGEALRITSAASSLGWAMYRIPLSSGPGAVSIDANLRASGDGSPGEYWVALGDYGNESWHWHGPFTDSHVRISAVASARAGADYTSELGNVFVLIAAYDGSAVDIVAVGAEAVDSADSSAPDAPTGLSATPVAGGLALQWNDVIAGDLAGYLVHWAYSPFTDPAAASVNTITNIQNRTEYVLPIPQQRLTYVSVSAIDVSGNTSALSNHTSALPGTGSAPALLVSVDSTAVLRGEAVTVTATGADEYAWDLDGDGTYDVTGDTSGTQTVDTDSTGIIRPGVRGTTGGETMGTALGSVSLFVTGNSRPVAVASATPTSGTAPLTVSFDGSDSTDFDGSVVGGGWDFDGDGTYDVWADEELTHVTAASHEYTAPGVYNAKLRVVDDLGAWDVDTVSILVEAAPDPDNVAPTADLSADVTSGDAPLVVSFDASGSTDSDGSIVEYAWDWDGDGLYDAVGDAPTASHTFTTAGSPEVKVRVEDNAGARATATLTITVNVPGNTPPTAALSATPTSGDSPLAVTLDASGSTDSDGTIVNYEWDFDGDGLYDGYGEGSAIGHTYNTAGTYTAKVRVTDDAGAQDTATIGITVTDPINASPVASLTADKTASYAPFTINFDASGSTDSDGSIVLYEWDFDGDGAYDAEGESATTSYTSPVYGWYEAKVRVTDNLGATDTATIDITLPSEWWMFGGNPQRTGLSPYTGAQTNNLKWGYKANADVTSPAAIDPEGNIYYGAFSRLMALNPAGDKKWSYDASGSINATPIISADRVIYVSCSDGYLYAMYTGGTVKWTLQLGSQLASSPAISSEGTIYVGSYDNNLYAVNPDGTVRWSFLTGASVSSSPAIGQDGTIYVGSMDDNLYAINPDGTQKWLFAAGGAVTSSPAIGADGTVYVGSNDNKLYAINADGTEQWSFTTGGIYYSSPAIGADGTVYVGSIDNKLYAINPDGTEQWSFTTGNQISSSPAIGADGTVYVGSTDQYVYAINPDGTEKWSFETNSAPVSSPAISADGTVYVGSNKLFAFGPSS